MQSILKDFASLASLASFAVMLIMWADGIGRAVM